MCGAGTGGVVNVAKGLKRLLDKKQKRARREKVMKGGEKINSDDEEEDGGDGEGVNEGPGDFRIES